VDRLLFRRPIIAGLLPLALVAASAARAATTGGAAPEPAPPRSAGCAAPAGPSGDADLAFVSHGVRRTARVHVAPGAAGRPAPLLLVFHGTGSNGRTMERYSGLVPQLDRGRGIGVFPDAKGPSWNDGDQPNDPDDAGFAGDLLAAVAGRWCVDERRVSAAGVSNGGGMAALLACTMGRRLAGIAIVAGGFAPLPPCRSRHPVSVLEIHGRKDPVAPYWGLPAQHGLGAVVPWLASWTRRDACRLTRPRARPIAPGTIRYDWGACLGGTRVEHVAIADGRHQWPGATPPDPGPPPTISAAAEIWRFLAGLRAAP